MQASIYQQALDPVGKSKSVASHIQLMRSEIAQSAIPSICSIACHVETTPRKGPNGSKKAADSKREEPFAFEGLDSKRGTGVVKRVDC